MQFWIAATEIESVKQVRQLQIGYGAEVNDVRTEACQQIKIVLIVETERAVARDTNAWPLCHRSALFSLGLFSTRRRITAFLCVPGLNKTRGVRLSPVNGCARALACKIDKRLDVETLF